MVKKERTKEEKSLYSSIKYNLSKQLLTQQIFRYFKILTSVYMNIFLKVHPLIKKYNI